MNRKSIKNEITRPNQFRKKTVTPQAAGNYLYLAKTPVGDMTKGKVLAKSYNEAKTKLEHQGLLVTQLNRVQPWWKMEIGRSVPLKVLVQATRQLTSFAEAGIPLTKALEVLISSTENQRLKISLDEIKFELEAGTPFSDALARQGKVFPEYFSAIIGASESTGNIAEAIATLNEYLDRDLRSTRAVKSALYYPAVLMFLSIVAIAVLSIAVLPRFEIFFESLDVKLPLTTRIMIISTQIFSNYWWVIILTTLILLAIYKFACSKKKYKFYVDKLKLKLPILGKLAELVAIERFCRVLKTLVSSHVPLTEALTMAGNSTGNVVFEKGIEKASIGVLNGKGLADPLSELNIFPHAAIQIFRVGEESGQLDLQLNQASSFYSDELDFRMKTFTSLIEPVVLVVLGGGIGFVAVALISAMYGIYSGVQA